MEFTIRDRKIIIKDGTNMITLNGNEFSNIERAYNKEVYYREDVENQIDVLIESGDLPENAAENKDYINAVLDAYATNREEYGDGTDENLPWTDCLNDAFDSVNYNDYSG